MFRSYGDHVKGIDQSSEWNYHSCSKCHPCEGTHWYQKQVDKSGSQLLPDGNSRQLCYGEEVCYLLVYYILGNSIGVHISRIYKYGTIL